MKKIIGTMLIIFGFLSAHLYANEPQKKNFQIKSAFVTGIVEKTVAEGIAVIENHQSKSRVTYIIEGDLSQLKNSIGKFVKIQGSDTKEVNKFKKIIKLEKVLEISDKPIKAPKAAK